MYGKGLRALSISTVAVMAVALGLVFFWVPLEADQGFLQKIFYVHVPLAIVSLCGFVAGGIFAIAAPAHARAEVGLPLLRRDPHEPDLRRGHPDHRLDLGEGLVGALVGWDEPTLVSFLIVFLLYATYQPLRFAIEDPERQSRYASVFAVTAGAFVPLNFIAVRASTQFLHPRVLGATSNLPWQMSLTFVVSLVGMALLFATLCKYELTVKHTRAQLRALRRLAERRAGRRRAPRRRRAAQRCAEPARHRDDRRLAGHAGATR